MEHTVFNTTYKCLEQDLGLGALGSFVRNDAYANIAEQVRDFRYAPTRIAGFAQDYGTRYQLWTAKATYTYRHVCLADIGHTVGVRIHVSNTSHSCFFLDITIYDCCQSETVFVHCVQKIACQKVTNQGLRTTSWQKIPTIKDFVLSEQSLL